MMSRQTVIFPHFSAESCVSLNWESPMIVLTSVCVFLMCLFFSPFSTGLQPREIIFSGLSLPPFSLLHERYSLRHLSQVEPDFFPIPWHSLMLTATISVE